MKTRGHVAEAGGVAKERVSAVCGVVAAGRVVTECSETGSCVGVARSFVKEREHSDGRGVRAGSVLQKRPGASCRIRVCGVGKSVPAPMAVLKLPVRLL